MARQKRDDSIISSGGEGGTLRSALRTTVDDSNGTDSGAEIETTLPDPVFDGDFLYCSECDFERWPIEWIALSPLIAIVKQNV